MYKIKITVTLSFILTFMFLKVCTHCVLSRTFVPRIIKLDMWMHYALCVAKTNLRHFYLYFDPRSFNLIVECNPLSDPQMKVSRLKSKAGGGAGV